MKLKGIDELTLRDMLDNLDLYSGLSDGLIQLPIPDYIEIKKKKLPIPKDLKEFTDNLCYGQRLFMSRQEDNDFGSILRVITGYYYSLSTLCKFDEDKALLFGKFVLNCKVKYLYPVAMHLVSLVGELAEREHELLHHEPTKMEKAAGIEKLNVFSELTALDFLRDAMKCTVPEVLLTPYNECLVRFMIAKETSDFQERYFELMKQESEPKSKFR
jgi:hypothetical protein